LSGRVKSFFGGFMKRNFLDILTTEGILADGAIGTEIYQRGVFINRSYDELNLTAPHLIKEIHRDYLDAGAEFLTTNTFTANRAALTAYGLEDKTREINAAGAKLARKAAKRHAFVAGSVGPVTTSARRRHIDRDLKAIFEEQILALANAGVDVILFETFTNLEELAEAVSAAKELTDLPIISQVSITTVSEGEYVGFTPEEAVKRMIQLESDVVGVNCSDGPQGVFDSISKMAKKTKLPLSAMPNAGLPRIVQGRMLYLATPEYLAEYARRYAQLGVTLIGGCCGTTPAHIKEMKKYLKSLHPGGRAAAPVPTETQAQEEKTIVEVIPLEERSRFGAALDKKFAISVEIDPPLGINPKAAVEGARLLNELGVDAINIADGPRAVPRMGPMALAKIIKDEVGIETIVHYCCRDRNILGMQMDLLGAAALGLNNLLLITGDPPKMGHYAEATAVFDMDSIGLIRFVSNMNQGRDFARRPLKQKTSFVIGCGCNPGAVDLDLEVERFRKKVAAGAEYVFSQPVYDMKMLDRFLDKIKDIKKIPFFVGILPLVSLKNAEFLHNEVPGMQVPDEIMKRIKRESTKEGQQEVGVEVARDMLNYARINSQVGGTYIFPPLGRYKLVERLLGE